MDSWSHPLDAPYALDWLMDSSPTWAQVYVVFEQHLRPTVTSLRWSWISIVQSNRSTDWLDVSVRSMQITQWENGLGKTQKARPIDEMDYIYGNFQNRQTSLASLNTLLIRTKRPFWNHGHGLYSPFLSARPKRHSGWDDSTSSSAHVKCGRKGRCHRELLNGVQSSQASPTSDQSLFEADDLALQCFLSFTIE